MKQKVKAYDHKKIESKWQKEWEKKGIYKTASSTKKPKKYVLDMFPYPSGQGLHVGHPRGYIASDVYARLMRVKGFNVLHPMGYDAFGLPAEQYAIQHKIHPRKAVEENVKTFEGQLHKIGFSYDWSRKINTTDPKYYKWTQWIFLKLYNSWYNTAKNKAEPIETLVKILEKNGNEKVSAAADLDTPIITAKEWKNMDKLAHDKFLMKYRLAYEGFSEVNWCPELGTVLANDEIVDGPDGKPVSERGGYSVVKKSLRQWFLRITAYADRLIEDLTDLDWSSHIKEIQKNWIGKSEGSEIEFLIKGIGEKIKVFTTRADTLFGVTYVVLAPEHELVQKLLTFVSNKNEVLKYIEEVKNKTEEDRVGSKGKTGVELKSIYAINPVNNEEVPVWIADYVLASYGTGAVMAVPAHDERDWEFAKKHKLPVKEVIIPERIDKRNPPVAGKQKVERQNVQAMVKNVKTGKYLCLHSKKHHWNTFPMGGVNEGEDLIDAAKREVLEETGYTNLTNAKILGGQVRAEYFAKHKDQNRVSFTSLVYFELDGDERKEISKEEQEENEILWIDQRSLNTTFMCHAEMDVWLDRVIKGVSAYTDDGVLSNSEKFNALSSEKAREEITKAVGGKLVTKYKMRDAIFARQRYWGEPIPLVHEKDGTIKSLKEKELPLTLPNVKSYEPIGTGESPLAGVKDWVKNGYETNTMPGWAGSSWYFLRYMDPLNNSKFASEKTLKYWKQVDMYVGGAEHATGHLLYSRFWHKFLFDLKLVPMKEPFKALRNQGMILGSDNRKMSKRWGNVVNPDEVVATYGADTLRVFEMFIGPFDSQLPWSTDGIIGSRRFIEKVWRIQEKISEDKKVVYSYEQTLNKTIKKVGEDIESFNFNTAISAMMILVNEMDNSPAVYKSHFEKFLQILAPFAPHMSEELWRSLGNKKSIHEVVWPKYDPKKLESDIVTIVVQVNGKLRGEMKVSRTIEEKEAFESLKDNLDIFKWIEGKEIIKVVFVPTRLINIVVKG
ncbi:MAG: class I tRNA ligase family protein [bacterium]